MRAIRLAVLALIAAALALPAASSSAPSVYRVARVVDGDTLTGRAACASAIERSLAAGPAERANVARPVRTGRG
jgi:hypothetical protein